MFRESVKGRNQALDVSSKPPAQSNGSETTAGSVEGPVLGTAPGLRQFSGRAPYVTPDPSQESSRVIARVVASVVAAPAVLDVVARATVQRVVAGSPKPLGWWADWLSIDMSP
jgi:hypothetical protein